MKPFALLCIICIFSFGQERNTIKLRGHLARIYNRGSWIRKWIRKKEEGKAVKGKNEMKRR